MDQVDFGTMEQWDPNLMDQVDFGTMEQWDLGTMDQWDPGNIDQGDLGTVDQGDFATVDQGDHGTVEQWDPDTIDQGDFGTMEQRALGTMDQGNLSTIEQWDPGTADQGDFDTMEQRALSTMDQGDLGTMEQWDPGTVDQGDLGLSTIEQWELGTVNKGDLGTIDQGDLDLSTIEQWDLGTMDQGDPGIVDQGDPGIVDQGDLDLSTMKQWDLGTMYQGDLGTMAQWDFGFMEQWDLDTMPANGTDTPAVYRFHTSEDEEEVGTHTLDQDVQTYKDEGEVEAPDCCCRQPIHPGFQPGFHQYWCYPDLLNNVIPLFSPDDPSYTERKTKARALHDPIKQNKKEKVAIPGDIASYAECFDQLLFFGALGENKHYFVKWRKSWSKHNYVHCSTVGRSWCVVHDRFQEFGIFLHPDLKKRPLHPDGIGTRRDRILAILLHELCHIFLLLYACGCPICTKEHSKYRGPDGHGRAFERLFREAREFIRVALGVFVPISLSPEAAGAGRDGFL